MSTQPVAGTHPAREFAPVATGRKTAFLCFAAGFATLLVLVAWIGGAYLWPGILRYEVTTEYLVVMTGRRLAFDVEKLPLSRISEVSIVTMRKGSLRFGKAKPEYCVGYFMFGSLGEVYQAGNCGEKGVLLRSAGQATPLLVTPADPERFVFSVRNAQPGVFHPPARSFSSFAGWLALDLAVLLLLGGALYGLFVAAPARLRYFVRPGELEIRTLCGRTRLALAGAKVRRHRPLLGERLSGLALPAYVVGSFTYDHAATAVYASAKEEGVLYEGEGRVFLTPADIDGMLAALGDAGAAVLVTRLQRRI